AVLLFFIFINHPISYIAIIVSVILLFPFLLMLLKWIFMHVLKVFLGYFGNLAAQYITQLLNRNANTSSIFYIVITFILLLLFFILIIHYICFITIILSVILLFPFLLMLLKWIFMPVLKSFLEYSGNLAAQHLTQQLNRNANTASILAIGISVILLLSAVI